jgi:hypothetical protein
MVRPAARGKGMPLFGRIPEEMPLRLLEARTFPSGVVMHHYATRVT